MPDEFLADDLERIFGQERRRALTRASGRWGSAHPIQAGDGAPDWPAWSKEDAKAIAGKDPESAAEPPWPTPLSDAAYHGIVGEFVRLIEPHTEADPAALMFQFLTYAGNLFGNKAWYLVEDTHTIQIFILHWSATPRPLARAPRVNVSIGSPNWPFPSGKPSAPQASCRLAKA